MCRLIKLTTIIFALSILPFLLSAKAVVDVDSLANDMISQFSELVKYNNKNSINGESEKNQYVFVYEPGKTFNPVFSPPMYQWIFESPSGITPNADYYHDILVKQNGKLTYQHYVIVINIDWVIQSKLKDKINNDPESSKPLWYKAYEIQEVADNDKNLYALEINKIRDAFKQKVKLSETFSPGYINGMISMFFASKNISLSSDNNLVSDIDIKLYYMNPVNSSAAFLDALVGFQVYNKANSNPENLSIVGQTIINFVKHFYFTDIASAPCNDLISEIIYPHAQSFLETNCPDATSQVKKNALFSVASFYEYLEYSYIGSGEKEDSYFSNFEAFFNDIISPYLNDPNPSSFKLYLKGIYDPLDYNFEWQGIFFSMYYDVDELSADNIKHHIKWNINVIDEFHDRLNWLSADPVSELVFLLLDDDEISSKWRVEGAWFQLNKLIRELNNGNYTDQERNEILDFVKGIDGITDVLWNKFLMGDGGGTSWSFPYYLWYPEADPDYFGKHLSDFIVLGNKIDHQGGDPFWNTADQVIVPYYISANYIPEATNRNLLQELDHSISQDGSTFNYTLGICNEVDVQYAQNDPENGVVLQSCIDTYEEVVNGVDFFDIVHLVNVENVLGIENHAYQNEALETHQTSNPVAGFILAEMDIRDDINDHKYALGVSVQIGSTALLAAGAFAAPTLTWRVLCGFYAATNVASFYTINNFPDFEEDMVNLFGDEAFGKDFAKNVKRANQVLLVSEAIANPLGLGETKIIAGHGRLLDDYIKYTDIINVNTTGKWIEYRNFAISLGEIYKVRNPSQILALKDGYLSHYGLTNLNDLSKLDNYPKIKELICKARFGNNYPQISDKLNEFILVNKFDDFADVISNPANTELFTFFHAASGEELNLRYQAYDIISEIGVPVSMTELDNIAGFIKNTGKSVAEMLEDIPDAGGYLVWYGRVVLEKATRINLKLIEVDGVKVFTDSDVDDVLFRAWAIDDEFNLNRMAEAINELSKNDYEGLGGVWENPQKLKNFSKDNGWLKPELVHANGTVPSDGIAKAKTFLNEINEGINYRNSGEVVSMAMKHNDGSGIENEIDVLVHSLNRIVECKEVSAGNPTTLYARVKDVVLKFTSPTKLSTSIKGINPNHFGQLNIVNAANPYYNLNKSDFINGFKNGVDGNLGIIGNGAGQIPLENIQKVHEWTIYNGSSESPITITKFDWE